MTCEELLRSEHPEWSDQEFERKVRMGCPVGYGYLDYPDRGEDRITCAISCDECWDRETGVENQASDVEPAKVDEPTILDSGDRTEFASGARRDMRTGKGRFDISPLEVMADLLCDVEGYRDPVLTCLAIFLKTGDTSMPLGALKSFSFKAYNGCIPTMLLEVAKHFEEGAKKYGEANYRKGIPTWCYIDSAARHYIKWVRGDQDEPHDRAVVWNLLCCIWEVDYGEEWREAQKS